MKKKLAVSLVVVLLLCQVPVLALDRLDDYEHFQANYTSNGEVILRDMDLVEGSDNYSYSYDGVTWIPIEDTGPFGGGDSCILPYNGKTFMILGAAVGRCYASEDGIHWSNLSDKEWFWYADAGRGLNNFYFEWTGTEYIECQHIVDCGGMYGFGATGPSPRNSVICFLDENFDLTGEYDFGNDVADVGYAYGTYYTKTADAAVYSSADKKTWVKTDLTAIPMETPKGIKFFHAGDCVSGGCLFRVSDGKVLVSADGVSFGKLGSVPKSSWAETDTVSVTTGIKAYVGRDGVVVNGTYTVNDSLLPNGSTAVYTGAELKAALGAAQPIYQTTNTFVSDGTVIVRKEFFKNENEELGYFSWSYDGITWSPVQMTGGEVIDYPYYYLLPYNGKTFIVIGIGGKVGYTSEDGINWTRMDQDWFIENAIFVDPDFNWQKDLYQFLWTGSEYMMCQNLWKETHSIGWVREESPGNTRVRFLDGDLNLIEEYDFGSQVSAVGFADQTYYAKTGCGDASVIWCSMDRKTWMQTTTPSNTIPEEPAEGIKTSLSGDLIAVPYSFRFGKDGALRVSHDGVYWSQPLNVPKPENSLEGAAACIGRDGVILQYPSGTVSCWPRNVLDNVLPADPVYVLLDGRYLSFDVQPLIDSDYGRVLVPIRGIAEALGFTVEWNNTRNLVVCTKGETEVVFSINQTDAWVNGTHHTLETPARVQNNRTYIPISFLAEAFGLTVSWAQEIGTVVLTQP